MISLPIQLSGQGNANFFNNGIDSQLRFETGTTLNILKSTQIMNPGYEKNVLGMYTFVDVDREGNARFGSFQHSKHNLRSRDASCTWNPNGSMTFGIDTITTCAKQYQNEMCSSVLWDTCWEKLLDIGMGKLDFNSSPEGKKFLTMAIDEIIRRLHDDYYNVVEFSNHPNITLSNANDYWMEANISAKDWNAFKLQQLDSNCSGIWTTAERLKSVNGYDHFNVLINEADVDGEKYIGDAIELIERAKAAMPAELGTWTARVGIDPELAMPIIHVTQGIFNKLKAQMISMHNHIPAGFQLFMEGERGIKMPYRNVLMYDGFWVIARPDFTQFDRITGITSHIIAITAPGVLGITADVKPNTRGLGLVVTHRPDAPFNKTYFETQFRVGGIIMDHRFMTYGSLFLEPTV